MLKLVLRNDVRKNLLMLLAVTVLFIGFKIVLSSSLDRQLTHSVNKIALETKGMDYNEASAFIKAATAELMDDALNNHTGAAKDFLAVRAADIDSRLKTRLSDLNRAEQNINNAKYGTDISYGIPSDYFLDNREHFSELPAPRLVGTGWEDLKGLQRIDPVPVVIFLIIGIIYIREFEQGVYLSTAITKNGRRYLSVRFCAFLLISCFFALANFCFDVFASGILSSADIFGTPIQGLFPDCFVNCSVFAYLLFTLLFKLIATVNMFLLFYIAARISKGTYGYGMAGVSGILMFVILSVAVPGIGCNIAVGFPDTELVFTNAAWFVSGVGSVATVFGGNVFVMGLIVFCNSYFIPTLIL